MQLPKQRTEQEAIEHVQDENQELVLVEEGRMGEQQKHCLLYTSPSPRDRQKSRMPSSA